ncbi:MAG: hypothetical protein E7123_00630 [Bacteroidales bacterium]|nr:hypothetical protein [Bacteroidales bacterium]
MENREQQILSEIKSLMASVRTQLEQLDAKMAQLQQIYDPQEFEVEQISLDIEDFPLEEPVDAVLEEPVELPLEEPVAVEEPLFMPAPDDDLPLDEPEDMPLAPSSAVIDVMAQRHAWRTDMPGTPVKDIRGAIALVDRALFINTLFKEDAMGFMDTLNHINQSASLDEVVEYLASTHPEWDFDSDVVYRFMMAVRRKISR